jgi:nicotinamide-nucleotide amidase
MAAMLAEVISIGDELTSGQRLDTNSQWLSTRLGELGVEVRWHTTVADQLGANVEVFRAAIQRSDIVVASGGLGPTADDLTRDAIAAATGRPLARNDGAMRHIEALFARRKRPMPESNRVQAMFPAGSRIIPNPSGTAPGIDLDVPREGRGPCRLIALPGVPAELFTMWAQSVAPAIGQMMPRGRTIVHRRIKCFGAGESDLEQMLPDLIRRGREPQVGITVSGATITLRITAEGESAEACRAAIEPTAATIYECLGSLVFGEEDDELEHVVLRLLAERGKTLATVELGTGGLLADWLSEVPLSAAAYAGGMVLGSAGAGVTLRNLLKQPRGQTGDVVMALAAEGRSLIGADYAIATGELPRASKDAATPEFCCALIGPDAEALRSFPYVGNPDILKSRAAKQALNLLRLHLIKATD